MITFHKWHMLYITFKNMAVIVYDPFVITFVLIRILLTSKDPKEFI